MNLYCTLLSDTNTTYKPAICGVFIDVISLMYDAIAQTVSLNGN